MYQTLDGELTCERCTRHQCDGEIPDGAVWVDGGECYICAMDAREAGRKLDAFVAAAKALGDLWIPHADGGASRRCH